MDFEEFAAARRRKRAAQPEDDEAAPAPAANDQQPDRAPAASLAAFLGSRGFGVFVIVMLLLECAAMPLSLARLEHWMRMAAEATVYAAAASSILEMLLCAASVERFRLLVVVDAALQASLALALFMQVGREYPGIAWLPYLRSYRIFDCISSFDSAWQLLLDSTEEELRSARRRASDLLRDLAEARASAVREDETNGRLKDALEMAQDEAQMLRTALEIAAEQQAEHEAAGDAAAAAGSTSRGPRRLVVKDDMTSSQA